MYQDILAALLNGTLTAEGLREVTEVAQGMRKLGITLGGSIVVSKEAEAAARVVEGNITIDKGALPLALEKFKNEHAVIGKDIQNKIKVIKLMREVFGMGLADAKHCCESLFGM